MKKRLSALLMAFLLIMTYCPVSFAAEEEAVQVPSEISQISTGTQTEAAEKEADKNVDEDIEEEVQAMIPVQREEIKIGTVDELLAFAEKCRLDTWSVNKKVLLTDDISLLGKEFHGIPTFGGVFDGQGHTISGMNMSAGISHLGLFVNIQKTGTVLNLTASGTLIPAGTQINVGGIAGDNYGIIKNCNFKGVISASDYVGGIAGYNHISGMIENCNCQGYLKGVHFAGGIAGSNEGNIYRCTNESQVNTTNTDTQITVDAMTSLTKVINLIKNLNNTSEDANSDITASDIGGIAGISIGIITRCINKGDVGYEHVGYNIGGIAGRQSGYIVNCTNNGKILGRKDVAGIVGQAEPYITVDLSTDIAYQLSEAIGKLHDLVSVTLQDAKGQSDTISARLSVIQQFTAGAINDVGFLSEGTIDFANGVSESVTEAFSRAEYALDEASKKNGALDQLTYASDNANEAAEDFRSALEDLDLDNYLTDEEKEEYQDAKDTLEGASQQYAELYDRSYIAYYNYQVLDMDYISPKDLEMRDKDGNKLEYSDPGTKANLTEDLIGNEDTYGLRQEGTWVHTEDGATFPVTDENDPRYEDDKKLYDKALKNAQSDANDFAVENYQGRGSNTYWEDILYATEIISVITLGHLDQMTEDARDDAISSLDNLEAATDNLSTAGRQTRSIARNLADRDAIEFPQMSAEYKAHTSSLVGNLAGMNDNFGLLNSEINGATGKLMDDLAAISDQFNTIMLLYTDAIDGVLEKDYTTLFNDISLEEANTCTDATIDGCSNYGRVEGDIDVSGIAGTMAIEYEYDKESALTGIKDSGMNTSFMTKCVLRSNQNYGEAIGEKNYVGGICGLQEMGTIVRCSNYANLKSSSGERVGGIAGTSYSNIMNSFSKGILSAPNYVGGIAGDGTHIKDCFTLVKIDDAESWYGAIAGHVAEKGEVRDNFFVSDELAGIDRISYVKKAEPITYKDAIASDLPGDYKKLTITFKVEDDDLPGGEETIAKIKKDYGDNIEASDYPGLKNKDGYYASWDVDSLEGITTDQTVTATYKRYRTTLAEANASEDLIQSELLVDGMFREEDELEVERTINYSGDSADLRNYETLKVKVPDDGKKVHTIRFRPLNDFAYVYDTLGNYLGGDMFLYRIEGDQRILMTPTGTMGRYNIYEIEGNDFTLSLDVEGVKNTANRFVTVIFVVLALILILIIVLIVYIRKRGKHVPRLLRKVVRNVSTKIENKEQIFYDESKAIDQKDEAGAPDTDESDASDQDSDDPEKLVIDENGIIDLDASDLDDKE